MAMLQLCLCIVSLIHLTSSQSTYDVTQQENDVSSCGRTDQVLSQLVTAVSQMQMAISQLQRTVAKMESFNQQQEVAGIREFNWKTNTILNCQCKL